MIIALYFLAAFSILHFIYEAILLPALRLELRFRLFALRDELRQLKYSEPDRLGDTLFRYLQSAINNGISMMHRLDIQTLESAYQSVENNPHLKSVVEKRTALIDASDLEEVQSIHKKTIQLMTTAFLVNSGAWFVYVLPIVFAIMLIGKLKEFSNKLGFMSEQELRRIFPTEKVA